MSGKEVYIGPNGARFVPRVDADTIAAYVESGEWTKEEPPKKAAPRHSPKPAAEAE